jgi:hypothetical protein
VPTITKSIGTATRDYSTITAHEADLDNGAVYSSGDDAVGECYDDSVFDESVTINGGGTVGLASVTLTVAEGERHDGTAGTGARIVRSAATTTVLAVQVPATVDGLELDAGDKDTTQIVFGSGTGTHTLRRLLVHGIAANKTFIVGFRQDKPCDILNCICYGLVNSHTGTGAAYGISSDNAGTAKLLNVTVHGVTSDNGSGEAVAVRTDNGFTSVTKNVAATATGGTSSGSLVDFNTAANNQRSHNASSDTTASGTGSLTEIVTADQYVSTVVGSEDLHLKAGSVCIDAGTDLGTSPAGVNIDIDGRDRDAEGDAWDIGADEFVDLDVPDFFAAWSDLPHRRRIVVPYGEL